MALSTDEQRKIALYLKYPQAGRLGVVSGGVLFTMELTHKLQAALDSVTASGETTARALLVTLDALHAALFTVEGRFKVTAIDGATLNPKEWEDRVRQWNFFRAELAATLDVEVDPVGASSGGCSGPWREP